MKTKELIRLLSDYAEPFGQTEDTIIGMHWTVYKNLQKLRIFGPTPRVVANWLGKYTATPIEEREKLKKEEEKKYEIIFEEQVLQRNDDGSYYFKWKFTRTIHQTTFTQSEIENFPPEIKGAIECGFLKKVEVEE